MCQINSKAFAGCLVLLIGACAATADGQTYNQDQAFAAPYYSPMPPFQYYGPAYWRLPYRPSTARGNYMIGAAAQIEAMAIWNLCTSQANIHARQADRIAIENDLLRTKTFIEKRESNKIARDKEQAKRQEKRSNTQQAKAKPQAPAAIAFSTTTGSPSWPTALQREVFADDRALVEKLLISQNSPARGSSSSDRQKVIEAIERMREHLNDSLHFNDKTGESPIGCKDYIAATSLIDAIASSARDLNHNTSRIVAAN
jgi:hypothetical protein